MNPPSTTAIAQSTPPMTFATRNRRYGIPEAPAAAGTRARSTPTHRPTTIATAPLRARAASARAQCRGPIHRPTAPTQGRAQAPSDVVSHGVAGHRCQDGHRQQDTEVHVALGCQDTSEEQRGFPGQDQSQEQGGLAECQHADDRVHRPSVHREQQGCDGGSDRVQHSPSLRFEVWRRVVRRWGQPRERGLRER